MANRRSMHTSPWLARLRLVSTLVVLAALVAAAALLVIGLIPTSSDPSVAASLLTEAARVPSLLLIAEIARRIRRLLNTTEERDPFTAATVHELARLAKVTGFGGLGVWAVNELASLLLFAVRPEGDTLESAGTLLAWLAVALIFAAFAQIVRRGVDMRSELDSVI